MSPIGVNGFSAFSVTGNDNKTVIPVAGQFRGKSTQDVEKSGNGAKAISVYDATNISTRDVFEKALKHLDENKAGEADLIGFRNGKTGKIEYVDLSKLGDSNDSGKRKELIDSIRQAVDRHSAKDSTWAIAGILLEPPHFTIVNNTTNGVTNKTRTSDEGGFHEIVKAQTVTETKKKTGVDAKDLSTIDSLKDPKVDTLVAQVGEKTGVTVTPTVGFKLPSETKAMRQMLDGFLESGGFNTKLYNQAPLNKESEQYRKQIQAGVAKLVGDNLKAPDTVAKFTDTLFKTKNLTTEDVKTIQRGFAAMAVDTKDASGKVISKAPHPEYAKILSMPNPETGEIPKDNGIDGIPATRFAVVTSTLVAGLSTEVKTLNPGPVIIVQHDYDSMEKQAKQNSSISSKYIGMYQ